MILPLNLNRRHKVALFFTLALAGIAALNAAKMMEVVGILLLGLALAWAFGSDSRVVHWLFLSLGLLLTCLTVGGAWYIHQSYSNLYAQKVAAFEQRIPELANKYPLHKVRPSGMDRPSREWDEKGNPVQTNGQIILDKDLEPYLVKNPKAGGLPPESDTSGWTPVPEVQIDPATGERIAPSVGAVPIPQGAEIAPDSGSSLTGAAAPATLPADFFSHPPAGLFQLTMPDGHVRYFAYKRDADNCQDGFFEQKTQKMWNEAWVAGLDLCAFTITDVAFNELPGYPPKTLWGLISEPFIGGVAVATWQVAVFGVILFALGLGLILGIRDKPLPT
jgi:hypothetical protein